MYIAMVMEVGEIDLAKVLQKQMQLNKKSESSVGSLSPFFVRMVWQDMLEAVDHIHVNRIVHGDLKPGRYLVTFNNSHSSLSVHSFIHPFTHPILLLTNIYIRTFCSQFCVCERTSKAH